MDLIAKWISLTAALIALITAIISWRTSVRNSVELAVQKEKIAQLETCHNVGIAIDEPKDGDHVSSQVDVSGKSTIHEECRFIFIVVRGSSPPAHYWSVTDLVQINKDGRWRGKALLDEISIGMEATIEARVSANPQAYRIDERLSVPPTRGVGSNIIRVRRVQ